MRYYLISLGCPKNTIDAQDMAMLLEQAGYVSTDDPDQADILLVNTCGFIEAARDESRQVLTELARHKRPGQRLVAAGCWAQREGDRLNREINGLDGILGTRRWAEVVPFLRRLEQEQRVTLIGSPPPDLYVVVPRVARLQRSAYLKIADGCSAPCAFCAIPLIKGPLRSRPADEIVQDARWLAEQGTLEIILVAQDTTAYGRDRGEKDALPDLLDALVAAVPQVPWIRLMYTYPQHISARLIETMARHPQICHYLDLPLQHAHPETLKRMRRSSDVDGVRRLIEDLRRAMPDIALRTSFIVGYPGETEREFRALERFVREVRFDKVGVFTYSPEVGTPAFDLPGRVSEAEMGERYDRLMRVQQKISLEKNQAQVGRVLDVLVEGRGEAESERSDEPPMMVSVGRSYRDAPEIDGLVLIEDDLEPGEMVKVEIVDAMEYDLIGVRYRP